MASVLPSYDPTITVDVLLDAGTRRFATRDFNDGSGNQYKGTLLDSGNISQQLSDLYYGVEQSSSITLKFANGESKIDDTWDDIVVTNEDELRGRWVLVQRNDPTDGTTFEFRGKITSYTLGSIVEITLEMRDDDVLETLLPLGIVTLPKNLSAPFDAFTLTALDVGAPINLCLGRYRNVPLRNIKNDLVTDEYDYLIGYGPIESLLVNHDIDLGVKRDGVLVDTSEYTFFDGSNLLSYPSAFDNAWWTKAEGTISADGMTAPDGTIVADGFVADVDNEPHYLDSTLITGIAQNEKVTLTVYAKPGDNNWIRVGFRFHDAGDVYLNDAGSYFFNISTGAIGTKIEQGDTTVHGYEIEEAKNGFYRIGIIASNADANTAKVIARILFADADNDNTYAGDASTVNTWLWFAHLQETSKYPGYAFIRFTTEQMDFSGGHHNLTADIKGLEMGETSAERNFVAVIKNVLNDVRWGLNDFVDVTSFTAGESVLDAIGVNLIEHSHELDDVYYTKTECTISADGTTAPDGTTTADGVVADSDNEAHYLTSDKMLNIAAGDKVALTVYAKPGDHNWIRVGVYFYDDGDVYLGDVGSYFFNVNTGLLGTKTDGGNATVHDYIFEAVDNGFYRIGVLVSNSDVDTDRVAANILPSEGDNDSTYTGDDSTVNMWLWGVDLKKEDHFSAYVHTDGAALPSMYCDIAIMEQRKARDILDDLLFPARARLSRALDGEWEISIDQARSSVLTLADNDPDYGTNCEVINTTATPVTEALRRVIVHYSLCPGAVSKKMDVAVHSSFGVIKTHELPSVMEDSTAERVLHYIKNRSLFSDDKVTLRMGMEGRNVAVGQIVTVTAPARKLDAKEYVVEKLSKGMTKFELTGREYNASIYSGFFVTPSTWPTGRGFTVQGPASWVGEISMGDGTHSSARVTMPLPDGKGDIYFAAGSLDVDNWRASPGFMLGIDDSDDDLAKFFCGNYNVGAGPYMSWNGSAFVLMAATIFATSGNIGGFYLGVNDLWGGNAAIGNAATTIVMGNLDGTSKIALGPSADALTVAGGALGFIADGSGKMYTGDGVDEFFMFDGTHVTWKSANSELDASGYLTCVGATITGVLTLAAGSIIEGLDATNVAGWAHAADLTLIDGADLYALSVTASKLYVEELSAIAADLGSVNAGSMTGVLLTANTIQTALGDVRKLIMNSDGLSLHVTENVGKYGTNFKWGDGTHYGSGALAYIHHTASDVPFYMASEQIVGDFHFYNRAASPTGAAEVGDVCVVTGTLMICTAAGTPGTWAAV